MLKTIKSQLLFGRTSSVAAFSTGSSVLTAAFVKAALPLLVGFFSATSTLTSTEFALSTASTIATAVSFLAERLFFLGGSSLDDGSLFSITFFVPLEDFLAETLNLI